MTGEFDDQASREIALRAAQLGALDAAPRSRYRRFVDLTYWCESCNEVVLEVVNLSPYKVIRSRRSREDRDAGRWGYNPIEDPTPEHLTSRASHLVIGFCRCQSRQFGEPMVIQDLLDGTKRRVLSAYHDPEWSRRDMPQGGPDPP